MNSTVEIEGLSIIIVGSFNPQIFHPLWFGYQGLIRTGEAEKATIQIMNSDISVFSLGWVGVEITRDRAVFETNQAQNYEILRDLVCGTFKLLRQTPVSRFALNWVSHFKVPDIETWNKIGNRLTPKDIWSEITKQPGMLDVTIQSLRPDVYDGKINITVQPSMRVRPGVYIVINDEFDLQTKLPENPADKMNNILNSEFVRSSQRPGEISKKLLTI